MEGALPSPLNPPKECPFNTLCPRKIGAICETEAPPIHQIGEHHRVACHIPLDELTAIAPVFSRVDDGAPTTELAPAE